jgi:LuxR family transcriptional regulator, maltose regulon positive regulatory protein
LSQLHPSPDPILSDIPYPYGAVERPRLLAMLEKHWQHHVILVSGPAGYGKTILAAQFARSIDAPVAWYSLRPVDRDVIELHEHIAHALSHIPKVEPCQVSGELSASESAIYLARSLRAVDRHILIVLDDLHHLDGLPPSQNWLNVFIEHLPQQCHLMLVSRTVPDLSFIHLIAHGEIWGLGQMDLRFDADDLDLFQKQQLAAPMDTEQTALLARLDGWPAGIRLALQPLPPEFVTSVLDIAPSPPEALFEQLARLLFDQLPQGLQQFLLATSTLEQFNVHQCAEVLALTDSLDWLNQAIKRNVFLYQTNAGFSFHPLFRDLLQRDLEKRNPKRFAELHRRAARWFEGRTEWSLAFTHYMAGGDIERARQLAESTSLLMYGQSRFEMLLDWRHRLQEAGQHPPRLASTCSSIYLDRYDYEHALAELAFANTDPAAIIQRAFILQQSGHYQQALDALEQIPASSSADPRLLSQSLRVSGLAHFWLGNLERAIADLKESVLLQRNYGDASNLSHVLQDLQMVYARSSQLEESETCLHEILAIRRVLEGAAGIALALHNLGDHYHQQSRYVEAMDALEEGLSAVTEVRSRRIEGILHWTLGNVKRDLGAFQEAQTYYQQACVLCPKEREPQFHVGILLHTAYLNRWQQRLDDALSLTDEALSLAEHHHMKLEGLLASAHQWALVSLKHQVDPDPHNIISIMERIEHQRGLFPLLRILAFAAAVKLSLGETDAAVSLVSQAVQIADDIRTAQPIAVEMFHSPHLSELITSHTSLYTELLDQDFQTLRAVAQNKRSASLPLPNSPPTHSLRIVTLGQERISRNGEVIPISKWRGAQSREMFFQLLFASSLSRPAIASILWPESTEEQARENFNTTLYQARRAVGKDVILLEDGVYRISPDIEIWCDAYEIEKAAQTARFLSMMDPYGAQLLEKVVSLYQGEFLPGIEADWARPVRAKMRSHYIAALTRLGQSAQLAHDPHKAIAYWQQALAVDELDESVNLLVIKCYALDLGQPHRAIEYYQSFKQLLMDELSVEPGKELRQFIANLKQ